MAVEDRVFAREHEPNRPLRLHGEQSQHALVDHVFLAAETATDRTHDEANFTYRLGDDARQHVAMVSDILIRRNDRHHAVVVDIGEPGFRLEVSMLDRLRRICFLDHQIAFGEAFLGIADTDRNMFGDVIRCVVVQHRCPGAQRFLRIENGRQRRVNNID